MGGEGVGGRGFARHTMASRMMRLWTCRHARPLLDADAADAADAAELLRFPTLGDLHGMAGWSGGWVGGRRRY